MRKKNSELVIHITSFGAISFLFDFIIFPLLQFTAGENENFTAGSLKTSLCKLLPPVLILVNHNLFVSFVLFCWSLAFGVIIAAYAVGQKHCRQIGKARCFN